MAKLTKQQALDKLDRSVDKIADAAVARIDSNLPKLKASEKKLADQLKANNSADLIDTLAKLVRLHWRAVAEGATLLDEVIRRLKEFEKDDELFELVADEMAEAMTEATKDLEGARKELAAAKKLLDLAEKSAEQHASDSKQAREEWAEAVAEVDRLCVATLKEIKTWEDWGSAADAAVDKRDKKALEHLQKAKPGSAALDEVAGQPPGMAFKAFDKEYNRDSLDETLVKEIDQDRKESLVRWFKAQTAAKRKGEIEKRVASLKIEPRDANKALAVLGLPSSVRAKVQAALDGPAAALGKTLEAIARSCKIALSAPDALAKLKKAGI